MSRYSDWCVTIEVTQTLRTSICADTSENDFVGTLIRHLLIRFEPFFFTYPNALGFPVSQICCHFSHLFRLLSLLLMDLHHFLMRPVCVDTRFKDSSHHTQQQHSTIMREESPWLVVVNPQVTIHRYYYYFISRTISIIPAHNGTQRKFHRKIICIYSWELV